LRDEFFLEDSNIDPVVEEAELGGWLRVAAATPEKIRNY
jgi:hypothetical protein